MDKGNYAFGVLVDFQAAFDRTNWYFLLKKHDFMESGGVSIDWFVSKS